MRRIHALRHFLGRLGGRFARWWRGLLGRDGSDRSPVRELTESDFRQLDHLYAAAVALIASASTSIIWLLITWRPLTCL
ncbi:hypothetical protein C9I56_39030 [Paraburkholderia caribensis]|nr:hypothetical protein C9I56_39030 [Paraburkholderia caribensis]